MRFSRDKSPYKTRTYGVVRDRPDGLAPLYLSLSAEGLFTGTGYYQLEPDQLARLRDAIVDERAGPQLERAVAAVHAAGVETFGEALKTAPRGYPKDHPRVELLRYKGLATWRSWPAGAWLGTRRAKDRVVGFLEDSRPIRGWLDTNVGPSTLPDRGR